jgi:hypothetical protein
MEEEMSDEVCFSFYKRRKIALKKKKKRLQNLSCET